MTAQQEARTQSLMSEYAGEPVKVEQIKGAIYAFGSELACLRIFAKYNANGAAYAPNVRVGHSSNLNSWYFSLETKFS